MLWPFKKKNSSVEDIKDTAITDSGELSRVILSESGGSITPNRAMQAATVNTCVRILSESVAMLPFEVFRKLSNGGREKAREHHLYDVLRYKPNSWQTSYEYIEYQVRSLLLRGNGYSKKNVVGRELRELLPIHPDNMEPKQNRNYSIEYKATKDGVSDVYKAESVFHIRDATENGYLGISRVQQAARAINIYIEAEKTGQKILQNGLATQGVIESEKVWTPEQKREFAKSFHGQYGGPENAGLTPLFEGGLKYKTINMTMEDAQFLETRRFQKSDIFGLFRVPPHIAQDYEKTTSWGTGIEQVSLQFVIFSLLPILRRIETSAEVNLLNKRERDEFEIKFNLNSLLRGDLKARADFYYKGLMMGWFSINDVRRLENMNPVIGGDTHRAPINTEDILDLLKKGQDNAE